MISQNAIGYEKEVKSLLTKSLIHMDSKQIDAWMKYQFEPSSMFIHMDDNTITACLQMSRRIFTYKGKKCTASSINMACTLPDYRQRGYFTELLDAALNKSGNNDLITLLYTTFPRLYESHGFSTISKTIYSWIPSNLCKEGKDANVKVYQPSFDLYSVYLSFLSCFDGNLVYSKEEFNRFIQYQVTSGKNILVMMHENKICGFVIYKVFDKNAQIDYIIYLNGNAVLDVFKYLGMRFNGISFTVSEYEKMDKLFSIVTQRTNGYCMAKCNNHKLFSKWSEETVKNANQIFDLIDLPSWNHFV